MDKLCPLMSKPVNCKDSYGVDVSEMRYEDCAEENCALYITKKENEFYLAKGLNGCCALKRLGLRT